MVARTGMEDCGGVVRGGGGGFGLAVVFGKSKVLDVGKALFSLLGLLVPSSHSNL